MRCYTRWSKGFGEYGLEYNTEENLYEGIMEMPDKNKIHRYAPLCDYLVRKKYYETSYNSKGELYWRLTPEGKARALDNAIDGVAKFADRFREWLMNADSLMEKVDVKYDFDGQEWKPCHRPSGRRADKNPHRHSGLRLSHQSHGTGHRGHDDWDRRRFARRGI